MPKESDAGEKVTLGCAPPVPLSGTVCGLDGSKSVNVKVAVRDPVACGSNVTVTVQEAPPTICFPQVLVSLKSPELGPLSVALVKLIVAVLVLVMVTVCALELPTGTVP